MNQNVEYELVPATPDHAEALAAIHKAAFFDGESWSAHDIARQLVLPGAFGFLAEAGGMVMARVAADEAEILTVGVTPDARRRGLGRALLLAAHAEAVRRGARMMFLEVADHNDPAHRLYTALGFAEIGRRRNYYPDGSDALVMRL